MLKKIKDLGEDISSIDSVKVTREEFLNNFRNDENDVVFRCVKETDFFKDKALAGVTAEDKINEIKKSFPIATKENYLIKKSQEDYKRVFGWAGAWQDKGYATYFFPNGNAKNNNVTKVVSYLQDLDFGKRWTGEYETTKSGKQKKVHEKRSLQEIQHLKNVALKIIKSQEIDASIINETKNGLHVYYLASIKGKHELDKYSSIISGICKKIDEDFKKIVNDEIEQEYADKQVCNLARALRVPGFKHQKDATNPFIIRCIFYNPKITYTQEQVVKAFKIDLTEPTGGNVKSKVKEAPSTTKTTIKAIHISKEEFIKLGKEHFEPEKAETFHEVIDGLRKKDLSELFQLVGITSSRIAIGEKICCCFHAENKPSAAIMQDNEGYQKYFCFSDACTMSAFDETGTNKGHSIFDIVMTIFNIDFMESVELLKEFYGIQHSHTQWQQGQFEKYRNNRYFYYMNERVFKEQAPTLSSLIRNRVFTVYDLFNAYGEQMVKSEQYTFKGESCFFFAKAHIIKMLEKTLNKKAINDKQVINIIVLLSILGVIEKVQSDDVPEPLKNVTKEYISKQRIKESYTNDFGVYIVHDLKEILEEAEKRAIEFKNHKLNIKCLNRDLIEQVYGAEFASKVYFAKPKKDYLLTKSYQNEEEIRKIILNKIRRNRYACFEHIKKAKLVKNDSINKIHKTKTVTYLNDDEKRVLFRRVISRMIAEDSTLVYQRLTQDLKETLNIKIKGFVDIIYRKEED